MKILLTNDDGIQSHSTRLLQQKLKERGHSAVIVVPLENKSAVSHGISLRKTVRVVSFSEDIYGVDGTPADAIYLAHFKLLDQKPDLVISGINEGANFGNDVIYSGTVAAAREAFMKGYPSIAVSHLLGNHEIDLIIDDLVDLLLDLAKFDFSNYYLNVNIPNTPSIDQNYNITNLSQNRWIEEIIEEDSEEQDRFFQISGSEKPNYAPSGSDLETLRQGLISVTPLTDQFASNESIGFLNQERSKLISTLISKK